MRRVLVTGVVGMWLAVAAGPQQSAAQSAAKPSAQPAALPAAQSTTQPTQPPQRFRSGVELVAIDVTVVDRAGQPVEGLAPRDFTVTVDGKPRRVVTAQFIDHHRVVSAADLADLPPAALEARPEDSPTSRPALTGRDVFLVIDEDSLETGDGQIARRAAMSLLDGLGPADRVGVAFIPRPKVNFTLTSDRSATERELAVWVPGVSRENTSLYWIGIAEAFEIEANDPTTREKVIARECGRAGASCGRDVIMEARQLARRLRSRGTQTLDALRTLGRALGQLPGAKTMVLVSGGVLTPESMSSFSTLEAELAASQVTLYTLFFEKVSNAAHRAGLSPTQAEDDRVLEQGLENVTAAAGGTLLRVIGAAEVHFARVAKELSASYLLGIEVEAADRNGKPHRVAVRTSRPGLDVHGRKLYVIPAEKTPPRMP